jgi:cytochrome c oxidase assembly protein subunit 15
MSAIPPTARQRAIALWLLAMCALIFAMIVLGGVTRLTRSGLSIVEWQPLVGTIPPLTPEAWETLFEKYRQTPEYRKVNVGMDLEGFKGIFWLEYFHRLLGRLIGLAFLLPFLYFLIRRRIERTLTPKLLAMFVLGGLQGLLGWLMVASGLVDEPRVSPYRLSAHLGLAIVIYAYILWVALGLLFPAAEATTAHAPLRRAGLGVTALVFLTILAGGFVAGTRAGFVFNDFPWMHGKLLPEGLYAMQPLWTDFFENVATVQFHHRLLAYALILAVPALWWYARRFALAPRARMALHVLLAASALQVGLGIATLIYIVPVSLGAAHQGGAVVVLTAALVLNHALRRAPGRVPRGSPPVAP